MAPLVAYAITLSFVGIRIMETVQANTVWGRFFADYPTK
jgi:hypothetical protein